MQLRLIGFLCFVFFTTNSFADIAFQTEVTSDPVTVTITSSSFNADSEFTYLYDQDSRVRFRINLSKSTLTYLNSQGSELFVENLELSSLKSMARKMGVVTARCPSRFIINRDPLKFSGYTVDNTCHPETSTLLAVKTIASSAYISFQDHKGNSILTILKDSMKYFVKPTFTYSYTTQPFPASSAEVAKFEYYASILKSSCPMRITYKVDTYEVTNVKLECDPVATSGEIGPQG